MKKRAILVLATILCATMAGVPARADHDFVIQGFDATTNYGDDVTLVARLLDTDEDPDDCAGGPPCPESGKQVDFYVNGAYVGTDITNAGGFAYLLLVAEQIWHVGTHEIRVQYDRDSLPINPATDTAVLTINKEPTIMTAREGYLEARLTTDDNEPVIGQLVRFEFNNNEFCLSFTDFDGVGRCLPVTGVGVSRADIVQYTAEFDGTSDYVASSASETIF